MNISKCFRPYVPSLQLNALEERKAKKIDLTPSWTVSKQRDIPAIENASCYICKGEG